MDKTHEPSILTLEFKERVVTRRLSDAQYQQFWVPCHFLLEDIQEAME